MKKTLSIYFFLFLFVGVGYTQETGDSLRIIPRDKVAGMDNDTILPLLQPTEAFNDTLVTVSPSPSRTIDTIAVDTIAVQTDSVFKPDATRSVWLGAVIPGYGQIANRKYWKLPIVYGGFLGFAYAISWNNGRYTSYKQAYRDISDNDPTTNYHLKILPRGYTLENYPGGESTYKTRLKSAQDQFRQYRDLSILLGIGYYALVLLEAYVDAQLYDFDISPDLVLNVTPARIEFNQQNQTRSAFGLQCSIRF